MIDKCGLAALEHFQFLPDSESRSDRIKKLRVSLDAAVANTSRARLAHLHWILTRTRNDVLVYRNDVLVYRNDVLVYSKRGMHERNSSFPDSESG